MKLVFNYTLFAILSTLANIVSQDVSINIYAGAYSVYLSMIVGTAVGLVVKYVLDKKFIFRFQVRDVAHDSQTFVLYTIMGVVTTVIFWGFELGFDHVFGSKEMRYVGAVLGLAIGYFIKYQLDKRFVFVVREAA
ncbi:MAG: GtrA family protein [Gammaproteobacteria bacterium]|nr:GtrA family protein [Gammaproteobacteria bacterium]